MYVPNPIRCRKCLKLGHFGDTCSNQNICSFCSKPEHKGSACETIVPHCVNCKGTHPSLDIKCPKFIQEKEIKCIQFREKVTYFTAKKLYKESRPSAENTSYAEITRNTRKGVEIGCQTDDFISLGNSNNSRPVHSQTGESTGLTSTKPTCPDNSLSPISPPPLPTTPSSSDLPIPASQRSSPPPLSTSTNSSGLSEQKKPGDKSSGIFKTPPLARRNSTGKISKKQNKINKSESKKSGDEMETS